MNEPPIVIVKHPTIDKLKNVTLIKGSSDYIS